MALNQKQLIVLAGGGVVAYFLLKKPKPGQPPNALQRALGTAGATGTAPRPSATVLGSQGGYSGGGTYGGTPRPTTTNLATQYGRATAPQTPSLQGFGSNPVAALVGGFANLAGSILKAATGRTPTSTAGTPQAPRSSGSPSGGVSGGGGGGTSGGGGVTRPGTAPNAQQPNIFGGQTTYSSTYNPDDYKGINPNTGLYDPDYDPSVITAGYFDPVTGDWVVGEAPPPADYSQLPGYGLSLPVLDDNGQIDPTAAPAQGSDTGTSQYQTVQGGVTGPDDAGYYYNPDGSVAWGYGEAPAQPDASWFQYNNDVPATIASGTDFSDLPGYGTDLPYAPEVQPDFAQDFTALPGAGTELPPAPDFSDPGTFGSVTDTSFAAPEDYGWYDNGGGGGGGDYYPGGDFW